MLPRHPDFTRCQECGWFFGVDQAEKTGVASPDLEIPEVTEPGRLSVSLQMLDIIKENNFGEEERYAPALNRIRGLAKKEVSDLVVDPEP